MDSTSQNPNDSFPITIRKTLARFSCYVSMIQQGKSHEEILKFLDISQKDLDYIVEKCAKISNTDDYSLEIYLTGNMGTLPIGGVEIRHKDGETVAYL